MWWYLHTQEMVLGVHHGGIPRRCWWLPWWPSVAPVAHGAALRVTETGGCWHGRQHWPWVLAVLVALLKPDTAHGSWNSLSHGEGCERAGWCQCSERAVQSVAPGPATAHPGTGTQSSACRRRDTPEPSSVGVWGGEVSLGPQQRPPGLGEATCASPLSQPGALAPGPAPSSSENLTKGVFWCGDRCDCLAWLSQDTCLCFNNALCSAGDGAGGTVMRVCTQFRRPVC